MVGITETFLHIFSFSSEITSGFVHMLEEEFQEQQVSKPKGTSTY